MKKIKFLYLLTILILSIQNKFSQTSSDSLWGVWEDDTQHDTVRLKALLRYETENNFMDNAPDSALVLFRLGEVFAEKQKEHKLLAKMIGNQSVCFIKKSSYGEAIKKAEEALSIYKSINDLSGVGWIYRILGGVYYYKGETKETLEYWKKCAEINKQLGNEKEISAIWNNLGIVYSDMGDLDLAMSYYKKSLDSDLKSDNLETISHSYLNLGSLYGKKGKSDSALILYREGVEYAKKSKDLSTLANLYNGIAVLFKKRGDLEKALNYYEKSLRIANKSGNKRAEVASYLNTGTLYSMLDNDTLALDYFLKGKKIAEEIGNKHLIAYSFVKLASFYQSKNLINSIYFYEKALAIRKEKKEAIGQSLVSLSEVYLELLKELREKGENSVKIEEGENSIKYKDSRVILSRVEEKLTESLKVNKKDDDIITRSHSYLVLGMLEDFKGNKKKALKDVEKSYELVKGINAESHKEEVVKYLFELYKSNNKYKEALEMYELYIEARDSLESEENQKALIQHEYQTKYEKQAIADSLKNAETQKIKEIEIAKQKTELKNKQLQQYALFGGLGLVVLFALFILKKNKEINSQKQEIENQKEFAEEQQRFAEAQKEALAKQHNQIRDSIDYAQTLQKAVLPSYDDVTHNFPNNFVLFQPKDVVSGDFFWTYAKDDLKYLAVVDCTGHGVPGAFMTIVANNLLNEIVQDDFNTPKEIVEELHQRIKIRVGGSKDAKVRDSMDLGLLCYKEQKQEILFVGTHTSLYLVRNGKLQKFKGSKADIGYSDTIDLKQHCILVQKNDMLYFHSDGYPDQKGGAKNKKFYYQPIRNKFEEISLLNLEEQKSIMQKTFNDWKGDNEQLDDVCMIGVRV